MIMKRFIILLFPLLFLFYMNPVSAQEYNEIYDVSPARLSKMTNEQLIEWYTWYYKNADVTEGSTRDYWEMLGYTVETEYYRRTGHNQDQGDYYYDQDQYNIQNIRIGSGGVRGFGNNNVNIDPNSNLAYYNIVYNSYKGKSFELYYEDPGERYAPYAEFISGSGVMEEILEDMDRLFTLPSPIQIIFTQGKPGPLNYMNTIHMTYEFIEYNNYLASQEYATDLEEREYAILGLLEFVLYHELGHAFIYQLDLPVLGKEEDAVDHFAATVAGFLDLEDSALYAADFFSLESDASGDIIKAAEFWDSHSLSEQRMYTIACLIYGDEPEVYKDLSEIYGFDENKQNACKAEYYRAIRNWSRLLGDVVNQDKK